MKSNLTFRPRLRAVEYGDGTFHDWSILIQIHGKLVGIKPGIPRSHTRHIDARNAALREIRRLKKRRLHVLHITSKCIAAGEARDCNTCAIAQALWNHQERMGYPRNRYNFRVSTYGAWTKPPGIVLEDRFYPDQPDLHIRVDQLPLIITGDYAEHMDEWTMTWDEWAESRNETLAEWRERTGAGKDETKPHRPRPGTFALDLDAFTPMPDDFD